MKILLKDYILIFVAKLTLFNQKYLNFPRVNW